MIQREPSSAYPFNPHFGLVRIRHFFEGNDPAATRRLLLLLQRIDVSAIARPVPNAIIPRIRVIGIRKSQVDLLRVGQTVAIGIRTR